MALRRDALSVALFPDRLVLARTGGLWRRQLTRKEIIACAPPASDAPAWQPPLAALAQAAATSALKGADVTVVLSGHFARCVLVPGGELLQGEEEQAAFARERLARVHGNSAADWAIRVNRAGSRQPRLACGVPQALAEALEEIMAPLGGRYRSLQPYLMACFNRWCERLRGQTSWLVVAEPSLASLALLRDGQWHSVRTLRVGGNWPTQLPRVLARERLLVDAADGCDRVTICAPELPAVAAAEPWKFEYLPPQLPEAEAPFTFAAVA